MKVKYVLLGVVVLGILGGAAFMAGRMLRAPAPKASGDGNLVIMSSGDGGEMRSVQEAEVQLPDEYPDRKPEVIGQLTGVEDNSVFVQTVTGAVGVTVSSDGENVDFDIEGADGPTVEVVVTKDTLIYEQGMFGTALPKDNAGGPVEPEIAPITLDEVGDNALVLAWGERRGDRLIAEVVVFQSF